MNRMLYYCILILTVYVNTVQLEYLYCEHDSDCVTVHDDDIDVFTNVSRGRLPLDLTPVHYDIELQPDIYTGAPPFSFNGYVQIEIDCETETSLIYLNQLDLYISNVVIAVSEDSPIQGPDPTWPFYAVNDDLQLFVLSLYLDLTVGARYTLTLEYTSDLQPPAPGYGMYWDGYPGNDGLTSYVVATQFQDSGSRYAVPCFDEPAFKATFNVTLLRKEPMISLSNMPLLYSEPRQQDWIADVYDQTPVMSSYLLCFVVGVFDYLETITNRGVPVRIYARPDALYAAEFANTYAAPMLEWFEEYTGIPYSLPKLDHIAIPNKNGAMENWGLSTYGEGFLLYDPDLSTSASRELVTEVVAHETAHMWFGDLVTCVYWNHTWLNEGFANFFQFQPMMDIFGWSGDLMQIQERILSTMDTDSVNTSLPVRVEVEDVFGVRDSFSTWAYGKGGGILRMIQQIIGNDTFRSGIQRYLNRFAFGNANTDDFWQAINEQIIEDGVTDPDGDPIDIKEKMDPWINQRGHPLVAVDRTTPGVMILSQEMFFNPDRQEAGRPSPWDYLWNIPVTFSSETEPEVDLTTKAWNDRQTSIDITEDIPDQGEWILLNQRFTGYYRVFYTEQDQILLTDQLLNGYDLININSRGQLISDGFQFARGNYQDEVRAMEFTRYLNQDGSFLPWLAFDRNLPYQELMLNKFNDTRQSLQGYMLSIVDPVYEQLGWESDGDLYTDRLREIIIRLACSFNNADCITESQGRYQQYQDDLSNTHIHPDQRGTVYCTAIANGDTEDWDFAFNVYQNIADDPPTARSSTYDRQLLIPAMACSSDQQQISSYLDSVYDPDIIRTRDAQSAMLSIAASDLGRPLVWQRLSDNWRDDPVPQGVDQNSVFREVVNSFNTEQELNLLSSFIDTYPPLGDVETELYAGAVSTVERNIQWVDRNRESLQLWFEDYTPTEMEDSTMTSHYHVLTSARSRGEDMVFTTMF